MALRMRHVTAERARSAALRAAADGRAVQCSRERVNDLSSSWRAESSRPRSRVPRRVIDFALQVAYARLDFSSCALVEHGIWPWPVRRTIGEVETMDLPGRA